MAKDGKNPITIDGVDYAYEDLTEEQQILCNHCLDLDRKINNARFNLDQLMFGKDAFLARLRATLPQQEAEDAVVE